MTGALGPDPNLIRLQAIESDIAAGKLREAADALYAYTPWVLVGRGGSGTTSPWMPSSSRADCTKVSPARS